MKDLNNYTFKKDTTNVFEGRPPGSKNKPKTVSIEDISRDQLPDKSVVAGKTVPSERAEVKRGISAIKNGTGGTYAIDPPSSKDEEAMAAYDNKGVSKNMRKVMARISRQSDFMVVGKAGWAKSAIIKRAAKMQGYTVIVVYLDKAVATDLQGIPVPAERPDGRKYQEMLPPGWVTAMIDDYEEHPNAKYMLFFDEMNQAAPDVQNALMPIILEHEISGIKFGDLFFVAAAGNMLSENENGVSELSNPLRDRLKPIIQWQCNESDAEWESCFKWAHEKYDSIIGPEIIDKTAELKEYWNSPRDLTRGIFDWAVGAVRNGKIYDEPEDILENLEAYYNYDLDDSVKNSASFKNKMSKFADYLYSWAQNGGQSTEEKRTSRKKGHDQIDSMQKAILVNALEQGYFYFSKENYPENGDNKRYLCTVENVVPDIFDPEQTGITAEVLDRIVREMESSGKGPKFKTKADGNDEAKRRGWIVI